MILYMDKGLGYINRISIFQYIYLDNKIIYGIILLF